MIIDQDCIGRFAWERAVRQSELPWYLKAFLLLLATYMDADGGNCRPSAPELEKVTRRSKQRVFEWVAEAEAAGWLRSIPRPGRPTLRVPLIPTVQTGDPSDESYGSGQTNPSDLSDGSEAEVIHTRQTSLTHPSDLSYATKSGPSNQGAPPPPGPPRPDEPQAARRTELEPEPEHSKTPQTQAERESPVPGAADELARRRPQAGRSWKRQRKATAQLDPETRTVVRQELEARRRRATLRVVAPPTEDGAAS